MAWDLTAYKAAYPEFAATPDVELQNSLDAAARRCDPRLFAATNVLSLGTVSAVDEAIGLMAAHILAVSPFGMQARLASDDGSSTYLTRWRQLARQVAGGPWATGRGPTDALPAVSGGQWPW